MRQSIVEVNRGICLWRRFEQIQGEWCWDAVLGGRVVVPEGWSSPATRKCPRLFFLFAFGRSKGGRVACAIVRTCFLSHCSCVSTAPRGGGEAQQEVPPAEVAAALPMAKHHPDLIMCRKQPGISVGRLCEKCDGKCPICDSYVRPNTLVRICDECNYGSFQGRCIICGGPGISDAYYCKECTQQEKDRDGCPKIVNLGSSKTDLFYERKKNGFKKR